LGKTNLKLPLELSDFVSRFELNENIWPVIKNIKNKYKIGLLTNMYPGMLDSIKTRKLLPDIVWDIEIDSSVVGLQKPDPQIYKLAQERAGVDASEILFVENSLGNIEAAQALGWQTFLYDSGDYEKSSRDLSKVLS
jgi:putative hydrolase of the HAD superfamily